MDVEPAATGNHLCLFLTTLTSALVLALMSSTTALARPQKAVSIRFPCTLRLAPASASVVTTLE